MQFYKLHSGWMKFNKDWLNKNWFPYTVAVCSGVILYLAISNINLLFTGLGTLTKYFAPVITGMIMAYVLSPLVGFFENRVFSKVKGKTPRRALSIICALAAVILFIVILMIALIPQIVESVMTFVSNIDSYANSLESLLNSLSIKAGSLHLDISGITAKINTFLAQFSAQLPKVFERVINVSAGIGSNVINSILGFILAIYFLMGRERIVSGIARLLKLYVSQKTFKSMGKLWEKCNSILIQYITYDILDGIIVGVVNWIFMLSTGMSYSVLISVLVGLTNLAPTFGPIAGAIIGSFILVLVNPFHALLFLIFTIVLQTIDGYIIKPKLFGGSLNVPSVWILVSLVVGGRMFGVAGIMLAIPFAAIVNYLYSDWIEKKEAGAKTLDE